MPPVPASIASVAAALRQTKHVASRASLLEKDRQARREELPTEKVRAARAAAAAARPGRVGV